MIVPVLVTLCLLAFCPPAPGQEIARVPVSEGTVTVERSEGVLCVVITSGGATTTIEVPAESTPAEPGPDQPPPNDPMARAVDLALEAIPPGLRPRVLEQLAEEVRHAITLVDVLKSADEAARLITSRAVFGLEEIGTTLAGSIGRIAGALHDDTIPTIAERLDRLATIIEERR